MRKIAWMAIWLLALSCGGSLARGAITAPGDIAFVGINDDGDDDVAVVLLKDALPGTTIHFADKEWNGMPIGEGGSFNSGEGGWTWVSPATTVAAGTIVVFNAVSDNTPVISVNIGTIDANTLGGLGS